ncbi:MAG: hypothetical protein FJ280_21150 [Planctomycetes bacterium]|nr:hypothetical protein [Planctomycetota bacterium]
MIGSRAPAGPVGVFRFYSPALNSHFYTAKESERDKLIINFPDIMIFEGIAWYAYPPLSSAQTQANP